MKVKIKFLEDRIATMEKSIGSINKILGRFQMTEAMDIIEKNKEQGFEDLDKFRDADTMIREDGNELI